MKKLFCVLALFSLAAQALPAAAQEFEVNQAPQKQSSPQKKPTTRRASGAPKSAAPKKYGSSGHWFRRREH